MIAAAPMPIVLDVTTLFVAASCITGLLGVFLLIAWLQDRAPALAWWGAAYLVGGASVAAWNLEPFFSPLLPPGIANAFLFVACGMTWNAARVFHGRKVLISALIGGGTIWIAACVSPDFAHWPAGRVMLSSVIVAVYTFMTAAELGRERRRHLRRQWPALLVPMLHAAVLLFPLPLAGLLPQDGGVVPLASGWVALFVLETMLYAVGTAFIVLVLAKERAVRIHKDAASTDPLTGLLNRRGFLEAAQQLIAHQMRKGEPVSALMFDLDHFKSINDRFGHAIGDQALQVFAATLGASMRATDILARFGGEEFVALIPATAADAKIAAERVRLAFAAAGVTVAEFPLGATVSIGVASGQPGTDIVALLAAADAAVYRAKANGRNRVEIGEEGLPTLIRTVPPAAANGAVDIQRLAA